MCARPVYLGVAPTSTTRRDLLGLTCPSTTLAVANGTVTIALEANPKLVTAIP